MLGTTSMMVTLASPTVWVYWAPVGRRKVSGGKRTYFSPGKAERKVRSVSTSTASLVPRKLTTAAPREGATATRARLRPARGAEGLNPGRA